MNALENLSRLQELRQEIARRKERVDTLRRMAERISPILREVQVRSSPDPSRIQALLAEAADEEAEILRLREELTEALPACALSFSRLPDPRLALLLEMRYLEGLPFPVIAGALCHTRSYVHKLHRQALDLLADCPAP